MPIHELTTTAQQDRERDLDRALAARRHLAGAAPIGRNGIIGRLRGWVRRAPRTPVAPARRDPTCV